MGLVCLGLFWGLAVAVVLGILRYFKNPRACAPTVMAIVFFGFLFPLSITFVLPIDVTSVCVTRPAAAHRPW